MQQKNQASMSEEEKEGEVIERRNTEEGLFFFFHPIPFFPLLRPFNRVMSFPVRSSLAVRRDVQARRRGWGLSPSVQLPARAN